MPETMSFGLLPKLLFAHSFVFVSVMIRNEDGGRMTALEDRVRYESFVIWHLDFVI